MTTGRTAQDVERWRETVRNLKHPIAIRALSAMPDLMLVAFCLMLWFQPEAVSRGFIATLCLVMMIEFLTIHSTLFIPIGAALLGAKMNIFVALVMIAGAYVSVAAALSYALDTWWPTVFFAWLLFSRFGLPFLLARWEGLSADFEREWLLSTLLWLVLAVPAFMLPIPALSVDTVMPYINQPENWVVFAIAYFSLLALYKLVRRPFPPLPPPKLRSGVTDQDRMQAKRQGKAAQGARLAQLKAKRATRK